MNRPQTSISNGANSKINSIPNSHTSAKHQTTPEVSTTTIREIRSRNVGTTVSNVSSRLLLANRRQAMSVDKLNGLMSSSGALDREKSSPSASNNSSPVRGNGGLNRTASRVSRFRTAKAVFERLSNSNINNTKPEKPPPPERPRGTVASRYAAAAAARAQSNTQTNTATNPNASPRSKIATNQSSVRVQEVVRSASNNELNRVAHNTSRINNGNLHPKPQPRVVTSRSATTSHDNNNSPSKIRPVTSRSTVTTTGIKHPAPAKPASKDLIDKIVLEIAKDALDPDCTIPDLSNCDTSNIPDTLDFERCFQDVEMMTEEEAQKLLSRNHLESDRSNDSGSRVVEAITSTPNKEHSTIGDDTIVSDTEDCVSKSVECISEQKDHQTAISAARPSVNKSRVRFSEEPVTVFDTHAVEDYDRTNDDIDPVSASAEYEMEKVRERLGLSSDQDGDQQACRSDKQSDFYSDRPDVVDMMQQTTDQPTSATNDETQCQQHNVIDGNSTISNDKMMTVDQDAQTIHHRSIEQQNFENHVEDNSQSDKPDQTEYIESLEREMGFKRILEQNLRDLQSQYYEAVRELDEFKTTSEEKSEELQKELAGCRSQLEGSQSELKDLKEQVSITSKEISEIKDSTQILEKKYHRAKKIIKDMQTMEQSFNRREQLYQQKLDEIEHELSLLIESVDHTIANDGLKYFNIIDESECYRQHQTRLDVFGLLRHVLNDFNSNTASQNQQIKQRVASIFEQQLATLIARSNGVTSVTTTNINTTSGTMSVEPIHTALNRASVISNDENYAQHRRPEESMITVPNSYQYASHRLSTPNLPHPIGVGGQPTKVFHGFNPTPVPLTAQLASQPSPPQSVNSYPSTNSLNSLNNNNNTNTNNNNTLLVSAKHRDQAMNDLQSGSLVNSTKTLPSHEDKNLTNSDIASPYHNYEWHQKPVSEWTTTQVSTWLLALGLDQYISKFEDRNVNGQSLINLDSTVLKGLGVLNSNDRNLLKKKIRELRVEMEKERKLVEKRLKEKSRNRSNSNGRTEAEATTPQQGTKPSWKRGLLS